MMRGRFFAFTLLATCCATFLPPASAQRIYSQGEISPNLLSPEALPTACLLSIHGLRNEPKISLQAQIPQLATVENEPKEADTSRQLASAQLPTGTTTSSGPSIEPDSMSQNSSGSGRSDAPTVASVTDPPVADSQPASSAPPTKIPYWQTATPFAPQGDRRRALPAPLDGVFPSTEWIGAAGQTQIGIPDTNPVYPLEKEIYKVCPLLKKARIEIYGWTNPGYGTSSSKFSNVPLSYAIVPRKPELDQQVFRIERQPDTVQQEHNDWGFRLSTIYGIDTRYTVSDGWYPASGQVLGQNKLYSWDPVECYGVYYVPKIGKTKLLDGLMFKFGRYISPSDIEAQLAPDNYLWTHSLMFTYDNYTQTGLFTSLKINKNWMVQAGIHAGDDIAPWSKAAIPTGEACLRWQSNSSRDSLYFTANAFNNGRYRLADKDNGAHGHDNLNQYNLTWGHRFSSRVHMMTEGYWLYELDALTGGTTVSGAPRPYFKGTGAGTPLPGMAQAWGLVNYTNIKVTNKDYITFRPIDFLGDPRGVRTGYRATYASWTVGWVHHFNSLLTIRPEIRYERALHTGGNEPTATPYNDGTRKSQFTLGFDVIQRF